MVEQIVTPRNFIVGFASVNNEFLGVTISAMCYLYIITLLCCMLNGFRHSKHISKFWYRKHDFVLCRVSQKFVTIVLTFSLKIILRQFLSPFHKDYLTTNFNLTTKITLTIKNASLGVLDTILCDKVCQWFATGQWFSPSTPVFSTNKTDRYIVERGVKHHKPSSLAT